MASTFQELLREGEAFLRARHIDNPRLDAELLLAHITGLDRLRFYTDSERAVDPDHILQFKNLLEERGRRRPVAQILGYRDFYNARFLVGPEVLIPRPETEELVEAALTVLQDSIGEPAAILDLCCGSGCIGLSLALELPYLRVDLTDRSPEALETARRNGRELLPTSGDRLRFFQGDLFQALPEAPHRYRGIVCNPPYIHPDEADSLAPDVRDYEPAQALFHRDPTALYTQILEQAPRFLTEDGFLYLELAPRWGATVLHLARESYREAELRLDLSGLERFVLARFPKKIT